MNDATEWTRENMGNRCGVADRLHEGPLHSLFSSGLVDAIDAPLNASHEEDANEY